LVSVLSGVSGPREVVYRMNYHQAINEAQQYLLSGDKKKALEAFKNLVSGEKLKIEDLQQAASQEILPELELR
jgi:hypothetical protein